MGPGSMVANQLCCGGLPGVDLRERRRRRPAPLGLSSSSGGGGSGLRKFGKAHHAPPLLFGPAMFLETSSPRVRRGQLRAPLAGQRCCG